MALTSLGGCVAANDPTGPMLVFLGFVSSPSRSELSSPTMGTICVSGLNGPCAGAPK